MTASTPGSAGVGEDPRTATPVAGVLIPPVPICQGGPEATATPALPEPGSEAQQRAGCPAGELYLSMISRLQETAAIAWGKPMVEMSSRMV